MGATVIAISGDNLDTQKKFKVAVGAEFRLWRIVATIIGMFGVKLPVLKLAKRVTFVIGKDRKIQLIETGSDAIDPSAAIDAAKLVCGG